MRHNHGSEKQRVRSCAAGGGLSRKRIERWTCEVVDAVKNDDTQYSVFSEQMGAVSLIVARLHSGPMNAPSRDLDTEDVLKGPPCCKFRSSWNFQLVVAGMRCRIDAFP